MDAHRRDQILEAYTRHTRRFDEIAARAFHPTGFFPQSETVLDTPVSANADRCSEHHALTGREQDVLTLVASGYSNQEIGAQLRITCETVKTHVRHILLRLGARNRAHAVQLGYQQGLLDNAPSV